MNRKQKAILKRDVPLFHVLYTIEEKANEIDGIGALSMPVIPMKVLAGFGFWAAQFILDELAACGDAQAKQWAADLKRSREHYSGALRLVAEATR